MKCSSSHYSMDSWRHCSGVDGAIHIMLWLFMYASEKNSQYLCHHKLPIALVIHITWKTLFLTNTLIERVGVIVGKNNIRFVYYLTCTQQEKNTHTHTQTYHNNRIHVMTFYTVVYLVQHIFAIDISFNGSFKASRIAHKMTPFLLSQNTKWHCVFLVVPLPSNVML